MTIEQSTSYIECLKDSPTFRLNLDIKFKRISDFNETIMDLSDSFSQSIKSASIFLSNFQTFCTKLSNFPSYYQEESNFKSLIIQACNIQLAFNESLSSLMDEFNMIQREFKMFSDNFKQIDGFRRLWNKARDNLDIAVLKSSSTSKLKSSDIQAVDILFAKMKAEYRQCTLNYMNIIDRWEVGHQMRLLRVCAVIANSELEYFKRYEILMVRTGEWYDRANVEITHLDTIEGKMVVSESGSFRTSQNCLPQPVIEGYLFRNDRKSWQKWQRRWFKIEDNRLYCCKRNNNLFVAVQEDLRICTAKEFPNCDRRFCFELIAPDRTLILQAEDEASMNRWIQCLQNGMNLEMGTLRTSSILASTRSTSNDRRSQRTSVVGDMKQNKYDDMNTKLIKQLLQICGNNRCCDCHAEKPRWSSCNLGVTLCTECSGAHRSLGVRISRVRSMTMDNWDPETLTLMFLLGNDVVNFMYESDRSAIEKAAIYGIVRPDFNTDMNKRKVWAKMKWDEKAFVLKDTGQLLKQLEVFVRQNVPLFARSRIMGHHDFISWHDLLTYGLEMHCLPIVLLSLTVGVDLNDNKNIHDIPLHVAAASDFWPGCEFLLLNGANINAMDLKKQTALHVACLKENILVVSLLLRRGAHFNILDDDDNDAYQVAVRTANADTVTLLRVHTLNENTKNHYSNSTKDEALSDIFLDFTDIALRKLEEWFFINSDIFLRTSNSEQLPNMKS